MGIAMRSLVAYLSVGERFDAHLLAASGTQDALRPAICRNIKPCLYVSGLGAEPTQCENVLENHSQNAVRLQNLMGSAVA